LCTRQQTRQKFAATRRIFSLSVKIKWDGRLEIHTS
jgi:hypothetical protein